MIIEQIKEAIRIEDLIAQTHVDNGEVGQSALKRRAGRVAVAVQRHAKAVALQGVAVVGGDGALILDDGDMLRHGGSVAVSGENCSNTSKSARRAQAAAIIGHNCSPQCPNPARFWPETSA